MAINKDQLPTACPECASDKLIVSGTAQATVFSSSTPSDFVWHLGVLTFEGGPLSCACVQCEHKWEIAGSHE